jgi:hypothetical protein
MVRTLAANGDHYNYPSSTFPDGGNTIDAILGLDGAGVGLTEADAATDFLADHVNDYIGYPPAGKTTGAETYAGPTAKLILGVVAQGGDPTDFAGQDLVARLQSLMTAQGRFSDASAYGDYSNTIGQALAVIALGRSTGSVPGPAGDYLLAQQCTDGGFRGNLAAAGGACSSDPDATAFAAQALVGLLGATDPATARALTYLSARQGADGGIRNVDPSGPAANANTTGVAAQAFAAAGLTAPLTRAQDFLASLQYGCGFPAALRGGIAFTRAEYAARQASGRGATVLDSDLRATPQATLGLAGGSLLSVTAEGASATAPSLTCTPTGTGSSTTTATSSTTTSAPSATTTSTTATSAAAPGASTSGDAGQNPASATPGSLAFTGADLAASALLGVLLLGTGVVAIRVARRKGAHA